MYTSGKPLGPGRTRLPSHMTWEGPDFLPGRPMTDRLMPLKTTYAEKGADFFGEIE